MSHCRKMQSRVAILDVRDGHKERSHDEEDCVSLFRNKLGVNDLDYAAAYYPWLDTTVVQDSALSYENLDDEGRVMLQTLLRAELGIGERPRGEEGSAGRAHQQARRPELGRRGAEGDRGQRDAPQQEPHRDEPGPQRSARGHQGRRESPAAERRHGRHLYHGRQHAGTSGKPLRTSASPVWSSRP